MRKKFGHRLVSLGSLSILAFATAVAAVGQAPSAVASAPVVTRAEPSSAAARLGETSATAAGSCWEIKQQRPDATDGVYWLLTPKMTEPARFYCDQTTDGGGWVLVAKGRNAWTTDYDGRDATDALLTPAYAGGADVHQLASTTVDQLLDGQRVDSLADGVRLRRATSTGGDNWQEVRFRLARRDRWVWSYDAGHPLASYAFDGSTRTGGTTKSFGTDSSYRFVDTTSRKTNDWSRGFAFGSRVGGSSASGAYVYSPNGSGYALPFTLMYLRPQVSSTSGFAAVPDAGTAPITQRPLPSSLADALHWGVSGLAAPVSWEGDKEVQAFTQSGGRMYVGGNFRYVSADDGTQYEQPFLAAFDVDTGEWIPSFHPVLNQQVRTLATLPDGRVVAGGMFTEVNGKPATGIVALDPLTGDTAPNWTLTIENRTTAGVVNVRTLDVVGNDLYIGGSFTHLQGTYQTSGVYMRNLARVDVQYAAADRNWKPNPNATVVDIDGAPDATRMYAAGYFTQSGDNVPTNRAAAIRTAAPGDPMGPWTPAWSSSNNYQQAVAATAQHVWVGGSEHSFFQFSAADLTRRQTTIFDPHGDIQAADVSGDLVFAGCHCNSNSYTGAVTWPLDSTPWTQADYVNWVGAFDASTGERVPGFTPQMRTRGGSGVWAITTDSNGRLWVGGDITTAASARRAADPSPGFARFSPRDATAPTQPADLHITTQSQTDVTLAWSASTDAGGVHYQVLRDDRPIAVTGDTTITLPYDGTGRYFVRAADAAGNVSASTPVLTVQSIEEAVPADATWRWWYQSADPGAAWAQPAFDDSAWATGRATLGWGSTSVATTIDTFATTQERPLVAYFRRTVDLESVDTIATLRLTAVADDGAAVYVNGVEVARKRLPDGPLTSRTYASPAIRTAGAEADPIVVDVPIDLLQEGSNTIAVETHLNYRATPDVSFWLRASVGRTP